MYDCEITGTKFEVPENLEFIALIPVEDYAYWKEECQLYPNPTNEDHCPPYHILYSKCTFVISKEVL